MELTSKALGRAEDGGSLGNRGFGIGARVTRCFEEVVESSHPLIMMTESIESRKRDESSSRDGAVRCLRSRNTLLDAGAGK